MKSLLIKTLILSALALVFCLTALGQVRCETEYRACVRDCNAARDRTLAANELQRGIIRNRLNRELLDCNIQFIGDPAGRRLCRSEAIARANRDLAVVDALDAQAQRDRLTCIDECRRRRQECRRPTVVIPTLSGDFTFDDCFPGGGPCRGAVSEFCQKAANPCDDCWRSMCGGGEWRIDSEVEMQAVTLVAVSEGSRDGRVVGTSSINGKRAILKVPRDLKLKPGETLYFQFRSKTRAQRPVKIAIQRDKP